MAAGSQRDLEARQVRLPQQGRPHYNGVRLHSALGYVAPNDVLAGKAEEIFTARDRKLAEARERRALERQAARQQAQAVGAFV